jgi:hypothetical protein
MQRSVDPAIFGGEELRTFDLPTTDTAQAALQTFLALTLADRLSLTRHVRAYCIDFSTYTGDGIPLEQVIANPESVWNHVHPRSLYVDDDTPPCVVVEAGCDWEPEHGLMLCFLGGHTLVKCGPYDGHLTNDPTPDDATLGPVVYKAHDPCHTTRRTT